MVDGWLVGWLSLVGWLVDVVGCWLLVVGWRLLALLVGCRWLVGWLTLLGVG